VRDLCAATTPPVLHQFNQVAPDAMKQPAHALLAKGKGKLGVEVPLAREVYVVLAWRRPQCVALRPATAAPSTQRRLLADVVDVPWMMSAELVIEKMGEPSEQALVLSGRCAGFISGRDADRFFDHDAEQRAVAGFDSASDAIAAASLNGY